MDQTTVSPVVPKSTPKDVFYYLLSIVTLYMSSISFGVLMFQLIDKWFPDALDYAVSLNNSLRWSAAILIVSFPVYMVLMWLINKDILVLPAKREIRVRKWLGYLTLFISAVVSIVDVATLVYNLLGGEITIRFVLKIIVVLAVAATIFFVYLHELRAKKEVAV